MAYLKSDYSGGQEITWPTSLMLIGHSTHILMGKIICCELNYFQPDGSEIRLSQESRLYSAYHRDLPSALMWLFGGSSAELPADANQSRK